MVQVLRRQITGQGIQICRSYYRQTGRVKRGNHTRIWRISGDTARVARSCVEDIWIDVSRTGAGSRNRTGSGWVEIIGVRVGNLLLVVGDAEPAAPDHLSIEHVRGPVEANLWSEVSLLRVPGVDSSTDRDAGQKSRTGTVAEYTHVVILVANRPEIRPAEAGGQCQIRASLPLVLEEEAPDILAVIVAKPAWKSGGCLKWAAFGLGCVVQEVPDAVKGVVRRPDRIIQIVEPGKLTPKLPSLRALNLSSYVLVTVSPLIQMSGHRNAKLSEGDVAKVILAITAKPLDQG